MQTKDQFKANALARINADLDSLSSVTLNVAGAVVTYAYDWSDVRSRVEEGLNLILAVESTNLEDIKQESAKVKIVTEIETSVLINGIDENEFIESLEGLAEDVEGLEIGNMISDEDKATVRKLDSVKTIAFLQVSDVADEISQVICNSARFTISGTFQSAITFCAEHNKAQASSAPANPFAGAF